MKARTALLTSFLSLALGLAVSEPGFAQDQTEQPGRPEAGALPPALGLGQNTLLGSVPTGDRTDSEVALSLSLAVERGLQYNLGAILGGQGRTGAEITYRRVLSELLPQLRTQVRESIQQVNLAAFGFPPFPGVPELVGPFSVVDARVVASQPVVDLRALRNYRAAGEELEAAGYSYQNIRDVVVLVVAGLYLQTVAGQSRIDAARAELQFAETTHSRAVDLKNSGLIPAIDVLRAQVQLQSQQQRLIIAENDYEKGKLNLARAIGLPLGQVIRLTDTLPYVPLPPMTTKEALARAYETRSDYRSALSRLKAAQTSLAAARAARFPVLSVDGDYGLIGRNVDAARGTFTVAANLRFPIFEGGRIRSDIRAAELLVEQRRAEAEDLRGAIDAEVRTNLLDVQAASRQVDVTRSAVDLSENQLQQAQDRFVAGVVNNLEVVQAQQAVAQAHEDYISSLNAFNLAKAGLARSLGLAEKAYRRFLLGETR